MASKLLHQQRILTTLRGAFIADTASMGTHWIYNPKEVLEKISSHISTPEFHSPPTPSFYSSTDFPNHYLDGMLSPYGEQLLFVTDYVASPSILSGTTMSTAMYEWATTFGGRPDHATLSFIDNMKANKLYPNCGADDDQAHIYMKVVPVTCLLYGSDQLLSKVEEIIRVHQNNDRAVAFGIAASRILEAALLASSTTDSPLSLLQILDTTYENLKTDLEQILGDDKSNVTSLVLDAYKSGKDAAVNDKYTTLDELLLDLSHEKMKDQPDSSFYDLAARSCALPHSFIGPIYQLYKVANFVASSSTTVNESHYINVIRENILAAGDTCSRAVFVGSVIAAAMDSPTSSSSDDTTFESLLGKVEVNLKQKIDTYATMISDKHASILNVE